MIRRTVTTASGTEDRLIRQTDHARLAADLARQVGGVIGARPARVDAWVEGVARHDDGWPLHDDAPTLNAPTLNAPGRATDVFEIGPAVGLGVWAESARRAADADPYAGLLVSLHSLSLSINASKPARSDHETFDLSDPRTRFEINRFQQGEIERQETLRRRLRMRVDRPLRNGLAEPGLTHDRTDAPADDPAERELVFAFRLLQVFDQLSLAACCTSLPSPTTTPFPLTPDAVAGSSPEARVRLTVRRVIDSPDLVRLTITPWPLAVPRITATVPYRTVGPSRWGDVGGSGQVDAFRSAYAAASRRTFLVELIPGHADG